MSEVKISFQNWLLKRNGQPREPVGRNYFSLLSGMIWFIYQWLASKAKPHISNIFCVVFNNETDNNEITFCYLRNYRQIWPLSSNKQLNSASMRWHKAETQELNQLKTFKNMSLIWLKKDLLELHLGLLIKNAFLLRKPNKYQNHHYQTKQNQQNHKETTKQNKTNHKNHKTQHPWKNKSKQPRNINLF